MRCRLQRRLLQAEAAAAMGINPATLSAWEQGRVPPDRFWPAIVAFFGYDPTPEPRSFGEGIRKARRARGLSLRALSKTLRCDWETLDKWERGAALPSEAHKKRLSAALGAIRR